MSSTKTELINMLSTLKIPASLKLVFFALIPTIATVFPTAIRAAEPGDEERPYYILMGEAEKAIADENYEEAAARLIDAMAVEPENPGNLLLKTNLGIVYSCLDRDSLAIATLDDVTRKAPNMSVAILNRGRIRLKLNDNEGALADFSRVISIDSLNADARYFRGMMALYGGDRQTAEDDLEVVKKIEPDRQRTLAALGALYSMTGRNREAVSCFEKLIESESSPEYYANLAGCHLALQNLSDASRVINDGLKLYPRDPELYYYRAWLNRDRFRLDDAHEDAKLAIKYGASPQRVNNLFRRK